MDFGKPPLPLNVQRWSQLMRKLGVIKGDNVVSEALQQVFPVIILEDDRPEHKFAAGERLAWGQNFLAPLGVGIVGYNVLQNPAGSGVLLIVEGLFSCPALSSQTFVLGLGRGLTGITLVSTEQPRDTRWQTAGAFGVGAPNIAGQIGTARSDTISALPFGCGIFYLATTTTYFVQPPDILAGHPVVLAPGDQLFVWPDNFVAGQVANVGIQTSFFWRERNLEPGELAP